MSVRGKGFKHVQNSTPVFSRMVSLIDHVRRGTSSIFIYMVGVMKWREVLFSRITLS